MNVELVDEQYCWTLLGRSKSSGGVGGWLLSVTHRREHVSNCLSVGMGRNWTWMVSNDRYWSVDNFRKKNFTNRFSHWSSTVTQSGPGRATRQYWACQHFFHIFHDIDKMATWFKGEQDPESRVEFIYIFGNLLKCHHLGFFLNFGAKWGFSKLFCYR